MRAQRQFGLLMSALFVVASVAGCATDERSESASTTQSGDGVETRALPQARPQMQALRPLREAAGARLPQLYDLAVTAIGSTLRGEQRSGTWYTLLDTTLRNNGNQAILQADVGCALTAPTTETRTVPQYHSSPTGTYVTYTTTTTTRVSTFYFRPRPLNTPEGFELKSAESLPIIVETTTPLSQIPSGQQTTFIPESQTQIQISSGPLSVSCTARIIQPSGVIESNTANNTLTGTVGR